jgi:hypothetical protein
MKTDLKTGLQFEDLGYEERRKQLRYDYMHHPENHKAIKILAFEVQKKLKEPSIQKLTELSTIIKFLIDGFLAYEKTSQVGHVELDPITLEPQINNDIKYWVQYRGLPQEREIDGDRILYFSYSRPNSSEMSFMQSLYIGLISPSDTVFIKQHAKEIVRILSK